MAKKKSVSVLDVVRGLSQAAANSYDGAHMEGLNGAHEFNTEADRRLRY